MRHQKPFAIKHYGAVATLFIVGFFASRGATIKSIIESSKFTFSEHKTAQMHVRKVAVIFIYLVAAIVSLVFADKDSNKRMPANNAHAFQQMMRYGRSSSKDKINVYPRADVFYLGPRYGKRSRITTPPQRDNLEMSNDIPCTYTGVSNLYRCNIYKRSSTIKQHRI